MKLIHRTRSKEHSEQLPGASRAKRTAGAILAGAALGAGVLLGSPASAQEGGEDEFGAAHADNCIVYLNSVGYTTGPQAWYACETGAQGGFWNRMICEGQLQESGVSSIHRQEACYRAEYYW
ncbi:hypothetical protein GCM10029992_12980 [Glycomyces albus]